MILAERGREMFMEVTRRQDIIRFGKFTMMQWWKASSCTFPQENFISKYQQEQISASRKWFNDKTLVTSLT